MALADTLWKGKRASELEKRVIEEITQPSGTEFWDLFVELDTCFESIAANGALRLMRGQTSRVYWLLPW